MWSGIATYAAKVNVYSETGDLACAYQDASVSEKAGGYVSALQEAIPHLDEDAVGVAVIVGNRLITIDIFENPGLFSKLWPKLLRSYAMEAIAYDFKTQDTDNVQDQVRKILGKLYQKRYERRDGIALGTELSITTDDVTSAGLAYKGSVVHFAAFPSDGSREPVIDKGRVPVIVD